MRAAGRFLSILIALTAMVAGCTSDVVPSPRPTPASWRVMLFTWGHTQAFGTVTDTSSLATGVVATPGPNIVLDEKSGAAVALHAVIVRAIPGSDRGFVLTWTTGACNLDQRVVLSQDQDGALSVIVDRGPVAPATCDLVGLGAQVTVSTREPVSVDRITASITG